MTSLRDEMPDSLEIRLHDTRRAAGLSTAAMAERVGVTDQTIRNWENPEQPGKRPRAGDLLMWAVATNFAVEVIDPDHPYSGLRWIRPIDDSYAPWDSNPEPND